MPSMPRLIRPWRCLTPAHVHRLPAELTVRRRAVPRFPYHVVNVEMATNIRILAIAHDRRMPGYWKERLS